MFCLSDNDVILKLATCDLLDDALAALEFTRDDVYVLSTARFVLKKLAQPYGEVISSRIVAFLASTHTIDWEVPSDEILLFEDTLGIDPGEAVLYAATAELEEFVIVTGDKACLRALHSSPQCQQVARRLTGRIICFEQIIQRCIEDCGFDAVKSKIVPGRDCDMALRSLFASGTSATAQSVSEGLDSYILDLRSSTGNLLLR